LSLNFGINSINSIYRTKNTTVTRVTIITVMLALLLVGTVLFSLTLGSADLGFSQVIKVVTKSLPVIGSKFVYRIDSIDRKIILDIRFPRIILSVLVGSALAVTGVVFQALFRNPMADPYVIGTSAGAALGATLAYALNLNFSFMSITSVPALAFTGALLTTVLVYNLARVGRKAPTTVLLLSGIAVASFMSSISSLIMILHKNEVHKILFFLMGGFSAGRWLHVYIMFPYTMLGLIIVSAFIRDLDIMLMGEEKAYHLGMDINRFQLIMTFSASLLVASAVSVSGIIGFVGLVVPHMVRLVVGPEHRFLLPVSALAGGFFLLVADTMARSIIAPLELPVGVITSFVGAPFFLYLLRKKKKPGFF